MRNHSFTWHPKVHPQVEWTIHAFLPSCRASPHFGQYSFSIPLRAEGWVGLNGWLQTKVVYPPAGSHHPSTNWAWHRVTSLIETNTLPLNHAAAICTLHTGSQIDILLASNLPGSRTKMPGMSVAAQNSQQIDPLRHIHGASWSGWI